MRRRQLGARGPHVSSLALGFSMGMLGDDDATREGFVGLIHRALDLGVDFLDTSDAYLKGRHERWLGEALRGRRHQAVIASKFGNITLDDGTKLTNARPEYIRECCEASLARLGTDYLDLYYMHRVDPATPVEDAIGAMAKLVEEGKVRHIGICEAGVKTIERAHRTHPLSAVQTEYSLWARDVESEILPTCRRLGIGFVAYSALGRGLLGGSIRSYDDLAPGDRRRIHPRFHEENLAHNLALVDALAALAHEHGMTSAQIAIAWVQSRGEDVVPLSGTQRVRYLEENAAADAVRLDAKTLGRLDDLFRPGAGAGGRYPDDLLKGVGI